MERRREVWREGGRFGGQECVGTEERGGVRCGKAVFVHGGQKGAYFAC